MSDHTVSNISLRWLLDSGLWSYGLFHVGTVVFFVLSGRAAIKVRPIPIWGLVAGVLLLLLPSWSLLAVSANEIFGSHHSGWIAAMFVYAWPGVLANMFSTVWLIVYAIRRGMRPVPAASMTR